MNVLVEKLLESLNPSIRYRTYKEILGIEESVASMNQMKQEIENTPEVQFLLSAMHPDGYWLQTNPRTNITLGDGVEYGAYGTTHIILSYLSELGLTRENTILERAANRYLNLISGDGDWWRHMSCLYGLNIRTFIRLGYRNDERLLKAIELLLRTDRFDGGYLCDMHEKKRKNRNTKSCYRGSLKALLAFSELPELWDTDRCKALIRYFIDRNGIYNSAKTEFVNKDIQYLSYPITWRSNVLETLLALSIMGYGYHKGLQSAWQYLNGKESENGKFKLDWTPTQCPFKVGKRGEENDWVSFYVALAKYYRRKK